MGSCVRSHSPDSRVTLMTCKVRKILVFQKFTLNKHALVFQTEQFVHALKDELVKNALFALHAARPGYMNKSQICSQPETHSTQTVASDVTPNQNQSREPNVVACNNVPGSQTPPKNEARQPLKHQDIPHHKEYDEEEWASIHSLFSLSHSLFSPSLLTPLLLMYSVPSEKALPL